MTDFDYKNAIYIRGVEQGAIRNRILPYTLYANLKVIVDLLFRFGFRDYIVYLNRCIGIDVYGLMLYHGYRHLESFQCRFYAPDSESFTYAEAACTYKGREHDGVCTLYEQSILQRVGHALFIGDMPLPHTPDTCHTLHLTIDNMNAPVNDLFYMQLKQCISAESP